MFPGDVVAEVGERAADPRVAPRRILTRHPYDEFGHRPGCHRPSPTPAGTAIVLLGDQTPVPAENRVRRDEACHLTQDPPAECLAAHCESPALGVGQTKRSRTKMLPEDTILLPEIVDAIFLVASHPASQGQHEEMQSVGHGRRLHGSDTAVTHVVSGIHSPRPFSRTIRDAAEPARPDLWGARVSNDPGLPDPARALVSWRTTWNPGEVADVRGPSTTVCARDTGDDRIVSGRVSPVGGELLLSPQSVEIIKFGDPGRGR